LFPDTLEDFGCDRAAIVHGDNDFYTIVDTFGLPGITCSDTEHDFTNGRGVRLTNATLPEPNWNKYNWLIVGDATPFASDPQVWTDEKESDCHLIITELASPEDNVNARYVEIYSNNCAGKIIGDKFKLEHADSNGETQDVALILTGMTIGIDGFLLLCTTDEANAVYDDQCDYIVGQATPADNNGTETISIILCGFGPDGLEVTPELIDVYGEYLYICLPQEL